MLHKCTIEKCCSTVMGVFITLFKSITMFCGADNIIENIHEYSLATDNIVMDMNNVMLETMLSKLLVSKGIMRYIPKIFHLIKRSHENGWNTQQWDYCIILLAFLAIPLGMQLNN